jgi:hypothetical protein
MKTPMLFFGFSDSALAITKLQQLITHKDDFPLLKKKYSASGYSATEPTKNSINKSGLMTLSLISYRPLELF